MGSDFQESNLQTTHGVKAGIDRGWNYLWKSKAESGLE